MVAPSANHTNACGGCATRAAPTVPVTHGGTALQSSGNGHTPAVPLTVSAPSAPASAPRPSPGSSKYNPHAYAGTGTPDPSAPFPRPDPPPPSHVFNPEPELWHEVLRAIADPYQSLDDVAALFNTTLTALNAWMARPDIDAELDRFERNGARKARLAAVAELPKTVIALSSILDSYSYQERKVPVAPNTEAKEQRRRHGESSRKAAWLIYRIARFYAGPPAPPTARRVQAHPANDGTEITAPALTQLQPSSQLKSLPPPHDFAHALESMIAQFHATGALHSNGIAHADTVACEHARTDPTSTAPTNTALQAAPLDSTPRSAHLDSTPNSAHLDSTPTTAQKSRGAAPASSPGREPRVNRAISPSPVGAPLHPTDRAGASFAPHPRANAPP